MDIRSEDAEGKNRFDFYLETNPIKEVNNFNVRLVPRNSAYLLNENLENIKKEVKVKDILSKMENLSEIFVYGNHNMFGFDKDYGVCVNCKLGNIVELDT